MKPPKDLEQLIDWFFKREVRSPLHRGGDSAMRKLLSRALAAEIRKYAVVTRKETE